MTDAGANQFFAVDLLPWTQVEIADDLGAFCNICRWSGADFRTPPHPEAAHCPNCDSIARERFLHWCWIRDWRPIRGARVIENSPRLGDGYRAVMQRRLQYRTSDYDLRAHRGDIQLDLQSIDLRSSSVDVMLSTHVLEHVPATAKAIAEIRRVLGPGGMLVLQVPLAEPVTVPPSEPEFHADDTPVFWRFGFDLEDQLVAGGFEVRTHITAGFQADIDAAAGGEGGPLAASGVDRSFVVSTDRREASALGLAPNEYFVTWVCTLPSNRARRLSRRVRIVATRTMAKARWVLRR